MYLRHAADPIKFGFRKVACFCFLPSGANPAIASVSR